MRLAILLIVCLASVALAQQSAEINVLSSSSGGFVDQDSNGAPVVLLTTQTSDAPILFESPVIHTISASSMDKSPSDHSDEETWKTFLPAIVLFEIAVILGLILLGFKILSVIWEYVRPNAPYQDVIEDFAKFAI